MEFQDAFKFFIPKGARAHYKRIIQAATADSLLIAFAYLAVFSVRAFMSPLNYLESLPFILFVVVVTVLLLYAFGVYHRLWEFCSGHEITLLLKPLAAAVVATIVVDLLIQPRPMPLSVVLVASPLATSGLIAIRYRSRLIKGFFRRLRALWAKETTQEAPKTRVLIVGAGESGQTLALRLKHRLPGHEAYAVIGFIDDDPNKQDLYIEGCPVLGTRVDIGQMAEEYHIDLIVVAMHNISGADFREILEFCEHTTAMIKVLPNLMEFVNSTQGAPLLRNVEPEDLIGRKPISREKAVDLKPVMDKVILVTGAAGSIGSELSRQVMTYEPVKVILLDNNESGLHDLVTQLKTRFPDIPLVPVLADITLPALIRTVFEEHRPQVVFHAAAYKHVPMLEYYPGEAVRVNLGGTALVARTAADYGVERFVLISTDKAVNPSSVMGASKRACELFLRALSWQETSTLFTSVRFGNVLGSRGSVLPTFNSQIDNGGPVTVTHPEMTRYFMSIPEAVNLIIHAACLTKGDDLFMLRMGEVVRIVELAERMIRLRGLRPGKDITIQFTGIRPGEKMHEELFDSSETQEETVHPNIVQLQPKRTDFDADGFLRGVEQLLSHPHERYDSVFEQLMRLINHHPIPYRQNGAKASMTPKSAP